MVVLFVDLKTAFDSVDRGKLIEAMRERGVREGLVRRCEEVLRETISRVNVRDKEGDRFWTGREVTQGCPLSTSVFTLLMADIDEYLKKGSWGGLKVGGTHRRMYTYADDIAMIA